MEVLDRGFVFRTHHTQDASNANLALVEGEYRRFQTQAPIRRTQKFELEFFGRGSGMQLGVAARPRRATPQAMAADTRRGFAVTARSDVAATGAAITASPLPRTTQPDFGSRIDDAGIFTGATVTPLAPPTGPGGGGTTGDGGGGGGGGGGANTLHGAVLIELFIFGANQPVQTWFLEEGLGPPERRVTFEIQGFPTPDSPMLRTGWWRMVVTPIGPDPVEIAIGAYVRIGSVPIRTTPISARLANHLFRVALEALVPQAEINGTRFSVSIGPEIAELVGRAPSLLSGSIDPLVSHARLRSLDITSVSGAELHTIALQHWRKRFSSDGSAAPNSAVDAAIALFMKDELQRLAAVQPDDVCIRIQAAFSDASVSVWGFDAASLRGDLGELVLAFDHTLSTMRPFSFLDVKFSTIVSIAIEIIGLFKEVPSNVNKIIEQHLGAFEVYRDINSYLRAFVARAVGQNSVFQGVKFASNAWQIRHSDDPVIPRPGDVTLPPVGGGPLDGGVIEILARANVFGDAEPSAAAEAADPAAPPAPAAALPVGFLPPADQLARLDQHTSIVVVMMENRSYDHLLGDLMNARPRPSNGYDGAPGGIQNAGVAGFLRGVPTVHTRDLRLGTQIPVSPRHSVGAVQFQIGDGTEAGAGTGDMAGFARDLYRKTDSPQLALTVYGEAELPVHYKLADEFCVCDRWFAAHPGPTFPNRFATIMGRIPELDNFENDDPRIGFLKDRNLLDVLTAAGVEWRVFESDLSLVRMFDRYRLDDRRVLPIDDATDGLEATLRRPGPLPRVMFIEPNFSDIPPLKTADDDHPPADLANGQAFLSRVCDLLWDTGRFRDTLLVITYDEHGGFYDHVPPPGTPKGVPGSFAPLIPGGPTHLGVRVPALVISPFVSAGKIERTVFDHTSILKTILVHNRERLGDSQVLSFGRRVNEANDLSAVLDLSSPRQAPVPFVRRKPGGTPPRFGHLVDLATVLELAATGATTSTTTAPTASTGDETTPRVVRVTERTVEPGPAEPQDYHAALARLLKPRRPG